MAGVSVKAETDCPLIITAQVTSGGAPRFGSRLGGRMAVMTVGGMVLGALVML